MEYLELVELRKAKFEERKALLEGYKEEVEKRDLTSAEESQIESLTTEITDLESKIEAYNNRNNNKNINKNNMEKRFGELIVRNSAGLLDPFKVDMRTLTNANSDAIVENSNSGDLAVVGYTPAYKNFGVTVYPNLTSTLTLPFINAMVAAKKDSGETNYNSEVIGSVKLEPERFVISEKVDKTLFAVGSEGALQSFIREMALACDRAIEAEIYKQVVSGSTAVTGLTAYTTTNLDTLVASVKSSDVKVLMPRAEFYKAKGVKADAGSGLFLANKVNGYQGNLWDGTTLFYSDMFTGSTIAAADLKYVVVGEFGAEYEVETLKLPSSGQIELTVTKIASVKLRCANAAKKAVIA